MFYHHRKDFDYTLTIINKKMASILDAKQLEAQEKKEAEEDFKDEMGIGDIPHMNTI